MKFQKICLGNMQLHSLLHTYLLILQLNTKVIYYKPKLLVLGASGGTGLTAVEIGKTIGADFCCS